MNTQNHQNHENQSQSQSKKKKMKPVTIVLIVCAALIFCAGIGIFSTTLFNNDMSQASEYIASGEFDKAKKILEKQLDTNGSQEKVYLVYADYYLAQGEYLQVLDILEKGIKRCSPDDELREKLDKIRFDYAEKIKEMESQKGESDKNTDTGTNMPNIDTIEIPDVVGMDYETAKEKLKNIDVEITVDYTYSNTLKTNCNTPQDIVVTQSLQGKVEKGNKMIIVVAKPAISIDQINLDINYVGGIDTTIDFTNNSDKQIAYIYFNVKYYDRMGYSASCSIKNSSNARLKLTGPVDANQNDDGYWEAVIYNSSVAAVLPQTIEIIFTDGTSQTIQNNGVYWHTSSYYGGDLHN